MNRSKQPLHHPWRPGQRPQPQPQPHKRGPELPGYRPPLKPAIPLICEERFYHIPAYHNSPPIARSLDEDAKRAEKVDEIAQKVKALHATAE